MQVALYLAGEITQDKESIPWVRCASGNVLVLLRFFVFLVLLRFFQVLLRFHIRGKDSYQKETLKFVTEKLENTVAVNQEARGPTTRCWGPDFYWKILLICN